LQDWLNHPSYRKIRDEVVSRFRAAEHSFSSLRHIIFLRGGSQNKRRDDLAEYLRAKRKDVIVFYAEKAWEHIKGQSDTANVQEMEEEFAKWADAVVIVVESEGAKIELGMFSQSPQLRKKLLLILDQHQKAATTFMAIGPVSLVARHSDFKPPVYADFTDILSAAAEIDERLDRLHQPRKQHVPNADLTAKQLLFFLANLVAVTGPLTRNQAAYYVDSVLGGPHSADLDFVLSMAFALELIAAKTGPSGRTYYLPMLPASFQTFVRKRFFHLPTERARVLSILQSIPDAQEALGLMAI
jgi:hypothetical protein